MTDWHRIVSEHGPMVWRAVYRLLGNEELARDCYQETFLAAMRVDGSHAVDNWQAMLRTLATRKAIDALRRRIRHRERVNGRADPALLPASGGGEDRAQAGELVDAVREVLAQIPPRQAEAFALRHFEQMDNDEIARRLGTKPTNVNVLIHRAIAKLKQNLPASVHPHGRLDSGVTP